jgi:hypothetical protein
MMSFMLCSTLHPDKYQKLCDEIDKNIPSDRLPSFPDLPNLPYLRAFVKENLRWRPVTAGGVPHKITTKDDIYDGYLIKKNSVIHAVQWSIHRDPTLYPEPETFLPERWLDPKYPTYSENIAERSLYIEAAMIAWACDIKEVPGKRPPLYDYAAGFNTRPNWFPFELKARKGRGMLVKNEFEKVWGERMEAQ